MLPLSGWVVAAVRRLDALCAAKIEERWLFPSMRTPRKGKPAKSKHMEVGTLNDNLDCIPGVDLSPHGVRYAFTTYGERDLGFSRSEGKLILDHMEGVEPTDVTATFYNTDPALKRKRTMLAAWAKWLDKWAAKAMQLDPRLADLEWIRAQIVAKRNELRGRKRPTFRDEDHF